MFLTVSRQSYYFHHTSKSSIFIPSPTVSSLELALCGGKLVKTFTQILDWNEYPQIILFNFILSTLIF